MTVSYQGPTLLEGIVRWSGTNIFDRVDKLNLMTANQIDSKDIEPFQCLQQIEMVGQAGSCKTELRKLIPKDRLSHFELAAGRCIAILK